MFFMNYTSLFAKGLLPRPQTDQRSHFSINVMVYLSVRPSFALFLMFEHSVQIGNQVVPIGRSYRQNVKEITLGDS